MDIQVQGYLSNLNYFSLTPILPFGMAEFNFTSTSKTRYSHIILEKKKKTEKRVAVHAWTLLTLSLIVILPLSQPYFCTSTCFKPWALIDSKSNFCYDLSQSIASIKPINFLANNLQGWYRTSRIRELNCLLFPTGKNPRLSSQKFFVWFSFWLCFYTMYMRQSSI